MSADANKLLQNVGFSRTSDLGFVGRFHHNYGFDDDVFDYLLDQKDMWGERLFYVNEGQLSKWVEQGRHKVREIPVLADPSGFPAMQSETISSQQFNDSFGSFDKIDLKISKGGNTAHHTLEHGGCISLKEAIDRNGLALNVGGCVTAMKWLHYSRTSLLAVFVVNHKDGLADLIKDPALSVFPKDQQQSSNVKSAIQIWKYDVETPSLTLSQVFDTSVLGATSRLSWVPVKFSDGNSGVLSGIFSDGKLHFFDIHGQESSEPSYHKVTKPAWSISLKSERQGQPEHIPITAYDFLDHEKVIVGSLEGAIAEYILPTSGEIEDAEIPSFVSSLTDSMITTICVADIKDSRVMLINTATAQSYAIQYEQMRQGRTELGYTISTLQPLYHRTYRIFVYPDSTESIGYTFARHPHQKHSLLLRTELISTFHISEYLNHPFAIVGNTCGDVYAMNIGRKIFGIPKAQNKLVVPLKIWTLFKAPGESALTLSGDYIPVTPDRNEVMATFTPPEVTISASAWNENFEGSSTYAFGTYTGLLVLERLDPILI